MEKTTRKKRVDSNIDENIDYLRKELGVGKSFDIIHLDMEDAEKRMAMCLCAHLLH